MRLIQEARRVFPRNRLVLELCDELERLVLAQKVPGPGKGGGFDRKGYMREYMRRYRGKEGPSD